MVVKDKILYGPQRDIPVEQQPIHQFIIDRLRVNVLKSGNSPWMTDLSTGQSIRYAEILPKVEAIVSNLRHHGLQAGDFVMFSCSNHVMLPLAELAVWCCQGVVVLRRDMVDVETLQNISLRFIICDDRSGTAAKAFADRVGYIKVFSLVPFEGLLDICPNHVGPTEQESELSITTVDCDSPVLMLNTSGTTGKPKWVVHTHKSLIGMVLIAAPTPVRGSEEAQPAVHLTTYSMMVISGTFGNITSFLSNKKHLIVSKNDDHSILEAIENTKGLALSLYPSQLTTIANIAEKESRQFPNLISITTGGYRTTPTLKEALVNIMPNLKHFTEIYAMTEAPVGIYTRDIRDAQSFKNPCSAKLLPKNLLKIVDLESGLTLGPGQTGEICLHSPGMFKGYWNNPEATAEVLRDGWLHTGDIGHYDEDGFIFISQRLKELIKCNLKRVDVVKIENLLLNHPGIEDAVVLGKLDDNYGEVPAAIVVLKKGTRVSEQDLIDYVDGRVADHEKLRGGVHYMDFIARTENGKPLKTLLKI